MNKAYLLTGGNTGNREHYLQLAIDYISARCGKILKQSAIYETGAWGKTDQASFLNQALLLHTRMTPSVLMQELLLIEEAMGRKRLEKYGPRIIDIDVLLYNRDIIQSPLIHIPHPELANRRFALVPLMEIAPRFKHPVYNRTISQLLKECPDHLPVKKNT